MVLINKSDYHQSYINVKHRKTFIRKNWWFAPLQCPRDLKENKNKRNIHPSFYISVNGTKSFKCLLEIIYKSSQKEMVMLADVNVAHFDFVLVII